MDLQLAYRLRVGDSVKYPADRGDTAYTGVVVHVSGNIATHLGTQFVWVTVKDIQGRKHVWPSNRLG